MKKLVSIILFIAMLISIVSVGIISASAATDIYLRGTFNSWENPQEDKMKSIGDDNYRITKKLPAGDYEYKYSDAAWSESLRVPKDGNLSIILGQDSTILFEVNTRTKLNQATVISGSTNFISSKKEFNRVKFNLSWYEHSDAMLCENSSKRVTYSTNESNYVYWNLIPSSDNKQFYLQNDATKNYVYCDQSSLYTSSTYQENSNKYLWYLDQSTGYVRILSTLDTTKSINLEAIARGGVSAELTDVPAYYMSSQFESNPKINSEYSYTLLPNKVIDTRGNVTVNSSTSMTSEAVGRTWTKSKNTSSLPTFKATNTPLLEAVYNLSAEEVITNEFQSTYGTAFYTGESWKKVWTRDTAMSCQFSLADVLPSIALNCAKEKVVGDSGKEVFEEDTGTGGSYPCSSDRVITMLSVWEIYLATGDKSVLTHFYPICENTIKQDLNNIWDEKSGLFKGETCGTDWRDQTYPDWVSETKQNGLETIADSKAASVNIIYAAVYDIMAKSAKILGKSSSVSNEWSNKAEELRKNISERLYSDDLNLYAAWEYADYMGSILPYKADVISNGYALMYGVGTDEQIQSILENYPLVTYGAPTVFPQKQGDLENKDKIYHNFGVWPGWEAIMMLGAKKQDYNSLSEEIWNSCIRGAATSLTNKEVINYTTGEGVESNRQLWSIAGTLSGYYKVLFGIDYEDDGLSFKPFIPSWCEGPFSLNNFPYQKAKLNITLIGEGNTISKITVNGTVKDKNYKIPLNATGTYNIQIEMCDNPVDQPINLNDATNHAVSPKMPTLTINDTSFWWSEEKGNTYYIYDGVNSYEVTGKKSQSIDTSEYHCYTVYCKDSNGIISELSQPVVSKKIATKVEAESGTYNTSMKRTKPSGYSGTGIVEDMVSTNKTYPVTIKYNAPKDGTYLLSCCYNNTGSNDAKSSNCCGIRSVYIDNKDVGALIFPVMQNFSYQMSSKLPIDLTKGSHEIAIKYDTANFYDRNMNIVSNNVQYDYFTFTDISNLYPDEPQPTEPSTEVETILCGDADTSLVVDVIDATCVQKHVAKMEVTPFDIRCADSDENKVVDVLDATIIQKYVAKMGTGTNVGKYIEYK